MPEVNSLILQVASDSVKKGADRLDHLSRSAATAQVSQKGLATTSTATNASMAGVAASTTTAATATGVYAKTTKGATAATAGLGLALKGVLGPLILVTAAFAGLKTVVGITADLEKSLSGVEAVTGATGKEMRELEDSARALGARTVFSASEAADAMQFLGMAGFETNEIIKTMPGLLNLAAAGQLDLAAASDIASNVLSGFRLNATEAGRVSDVLALAAASSNTNIEQLGDALSYAAPVAASFGISIEETAAAVGVLSDNGIQGQRAGTGLRTMLASLSVTTPKAEKAIASLGLKMSDINPQFNSLTDILQTLSKAGLDASTAFEIFGREGAPAVLAITSQADRFDDLAVSLGDAEGAARDMADTMSDNLEGSYKRLGSAASEFALQLNEAITLSDGWRATIDVLTESINDMSDAIGGMSEDGAEGVSNLNELIVGYDKLKEQERSYAGDGKLLLTRIQIRREILQVEKQIAEFSENEVALARAENQLAGFIEKEKELNVELQKGFFETEKAFAKRVASHQIQQEGNAATVKSLQEEIWLLGEIVEAEKARAEVRAEESPATGGTPAVTGGGGEGATGPNKELEKLILQLQTEEEAIETSYKNRLEIIRENTEAGSELRLDLETRAATERNDALFKIEKKRVDEQNKIQRSQLQNFQQTTALTAQLTGQLSELAEEGSNTQKALFIAQKGISIAQAIINTELAATRAAAEGGAFLGIPMATAIRAFGYASVGIMAGTTIGSFEHGGIVPGTSLTGDNLTANVNSGEMILNRQQQANLFNIANSQNQTGSGGSSVNITVENYGSSEISVEQLSENDIRIIARDMAKTVVREDAPAVIASEVNRPNSRVSKSLAQNTKIERRR